MELEACDIASLVPLGQSKWDDHMALVYFRYNTGLFAATFSTQYKFMLVIEAFEAWGEVDTACLRNEAEDLAERLYSVHKHLLQKGRRSRGSAKKEYD